MAVAVEGKEIKVGDTQYCFKTNEQVEEFLEKAKAAEKEMRAKPSGEKFVLFYMTKEHARSNRTSTKILYKETVVSFHPLTRNPKYKSHYITILRGTCKTSNNEEIAYLDMKKGFVRERDRELSSIELERVKVLQQQKTIYELQKKLEEKDDELRLQKNKDKMDKVRSFKKKDTDTEIVSDDNDIKEEEDEATTGSA
jgi:hypothetical protein